MDSSRVGSRGIGSACRGSIGMGGSGDGERGTDGSVKTLVGLGARVSQGKIFVTLSGSGLDSGT